MCVSVINHHVSKKDPMYDFGSSSSVVFHLEMMYDRTKTNKTGTDKQLNITIKIMEKTPTVKEIMNSF